MNSKPTMKQVLFRPVIFITITLGLLVIAELIAIGGLTWQNKQRIHTIESDIAEGRHLEESIFDLLSLQLKLAASKKTTESDKSHISDIENQLITALQANSNHPQEISNDLRNLHDAFAKAIEGDQAQLNIAISLIEQLLEKQAQEEEKLLSHVEDDNRLELELAIILPLLLFWIIRHFFRTNVTEPLDSLKELLTGLAEGEMHPIQHHSSDPLLLSLFDRYNNLVLRLQELEKEHIEYTNHLELKVRETSHALLDQSQQLAKAERMGALAELAASTAHELRNPLASIQLALENILQDCQDSEMSERLRMIYEETQRLTRNLNDLLKTAQTSAANAQVINIKEAIEDLLNLLKYQANELIHFECHLNSELKVFLPEKEFRQMLLNLLLNSIQAIGNTKGQIMITANAESGKLHLNIKDTGPGFDEAFLRHGIRPFVSLKDSGTGLGLTMVQRFIKDHEGALKLENDYDHHASVWISLPLYV